MQCVYLPALLQLCLKGNSTLFSEEALAKLPPILWGSVTPPHSGLLGAMAPVSVQTRSWALELTQLLMGRAARWAH